MSNTEDTVKQREFMSKEIGELLARLKEKNVFDLETNMPIILIDRKSATIPFKRTEILKVKRFTSLVIKHLPIFNYLVRHPSNENLTKSVERGDRIMGALDLGRTLIHRQMHNTNSVICSEIFRNYRVSENILLAMTLYAIATYCDKYIKLEGLVESHRFDYTIKELEAIRAYISILLSSRVLREVLPYALEYRFNVDSLLDDILQRIRNGKSPKYFSKLVELFRTWRKYIYVSTDDRQILNHFLQYHFMNLADINDLYECWVFCKVLYMIVQDYAVKLVHIYAKRKESIQKSVESIATFRASNGSFYVNYQPRYVTNWADEEKTIEDNPDIALEFENGRIMIIDAKNSKYTLSDLHPNLHQMRNYMRTTGADKGIFIHSAADLASPWKIVNNKTSIRTQIIWSSLIPGSGHDHSDDTLKSISNLVREMIKAPRKNERVFT